jgi:hypothetical protein
MELQADCGTVEEANAFMASDAFNTNPIGIRYDPDRLLQQYESGVSADILVRRPEGAMSDIPLEHGMT